VFIDRSGAIMKVEQIINEYANYKKKKINNDTSINVVNKTIFINKINYALKLKQAGLITVDEAIKIILEADWEEV